MTELLTGDAFRRLFDNFERTARRLETRDRYSSPVDDRTVRQFLAGEALDLGWVAPWFDRVRAATAAGKRFERVRVVTEPLSDYKRYEMVVCRHTVAAGEDIRYLPRTQARALGLPDSDFWVFDSATLALLHFTDADVFRGAELVHDPDEVARHERWIDVAQQHAIPYAQYVEQLPAHDRAGGA
jgi:hypothetical protein